ncbi:MAG TPA: recombinase family protein [Pseudonocardiaceae bacterium]|nr:recombinase family protein [Pseudonocardiaceae bacterium]
MTLVYCRISDDPHGLQAGVERQEAACRKLAEQLGWTVLDVLVDNDISAAGTKRRKAYERLLVDLAAGRAQAVIAWHPDRLYRKLADLERFIDVVNAHHIAVRTVSAGEVELSTPTGRAMARTAAVWAGHEVEHGIERMRAAKAEAAAAGKYRGGRRRRGYEPDGVTIRKSEAKQMRDAADRILAGEDPGDVAHDSANSIAAEWGIHPSTLRRILTNPHNAGLIVHEGAEYPAQWPGVFTMAQYRGLCAIYADPDRNSGGARGERVWLGSGLYLCGRCKNGTTMKIGGSGVYRCKTTAHLARVAQTVDDYVQDVLVGILTRPGTKLRLHDVPEEDIAAMQAEAVAIREEIDGLARERGRRQITAREYQLMSEPMKTDLAKIEARMTASASRSPLSGIADAEDVRAAWKSAPISRKRAILNALAVVTVLPAPRGRRPDGGYFDSASVEVVPK